MFIQPGTIAGLYRTGSDQVVRGEKGESRISAEDYAISVIDEVEEPKFLRRRFSFHLGWRLSCPADTSIPQPTADRFSKAGV
jgi:hypothetical protein